MPRLDHRADRAIGRIESARWLDAPSYLAETLLSRPAQLLGRPARPLADALHGTSWGHPVHPMLVTIPIGTWTFALALDLLGALGLIRRRAAERSARQALATGLAAAGLAATAGLADWQHTNGADRRVGAAHALINGSSVALNGLSLALRRRNRLGAGRVASVVAWGFMAAGGYLGGHLVYRRRIGTDHADRVPAPETWTPVAHLADLEEGRPRRAEFWDEATRKPVAVALVRAGGAVHALGARCAHKGGPLDEGWVLDGTLVCPWHGSRFDWRTGRPASGPATCPQPRYAVRVRGDTVEIRHHARPGEVPLSSPQPEPPPSGTSPNAGPRADDLLTQHHALIRNLFQRIEALPREDPERRDRLRVLATELDIHEHIEDRVFYPAVQPVSPDVVVAHSEHRQMTDLLAATLKLNTASPAFDRHLRALRDAVDHHAGSEESAMFRHAQRLGEDRLRSLGARMAAMMERERDSRWLAMKVRWLEGS